MGRKHTCGRTVRPARMYDPLLMNWVMPWDPGAHLTSLRRLRSGDFSIEQAGPFPGTGNSRHRSPLSGAPDSRVYAASSVPRRDDRFLRRHLDPPGQRLRRLPLPRSPRNPLRGKRSPPRANSRQSAKRAPQSVPSDCRAVVRVGTGIPACPLSEVKSAKLSHQKIKVTPQIRLRHMLQKKPPIPPVYTAAGAQISLASPSISSFATHNSNLRFPTSSAISIPWSSLRSTALHGRFGATCNTIPQN